MEAAYYALIKQYLTRQINDFGDNLLGNTMSFVSVIALLVLTLIILTKGFRIVTGRSQESLMGLVLEMSRNALIVTAATTMALGNIPIKQLLLTDLPNGINHLVTGSDDSPEKSIDKNLVYIAVTMAAMDGAQGLNAGISAENVASASSAKMVAALGVAGPPMTAGAMLLMYTFAINLFVGLGPIFILCLLHDATKQLFHGWLKYGLATMFSLAVLSFMTSVIMEMMLKVAVALWSASAINTLLGLGDGGAGLTSQAMQQGGIGLLMTVLLVTAPPMAAQFFGATIGTFYSFSQLGGASGGGAQANATGMPGQVGYQPANAPAQTNQGTGSTANLPPVARTSTEPPRDEIRTASVPPPPPSKALKVAGEA
ncbi:type IV secretion system protein [Variovorax sp. J22G21]|uniref:type IV secretion system protein n=1 Tax=Variovorax fucosicus TaxID=3053517 RepID=UPI0025754F04|nr:MULTISPECIES: type IV secretion system protein [unclassified Variovorax]MDM0038260.1 type IV secretion system protein [Variovorax sp. J22R193]MDM0063036.1 type IV secretion system protein [Variovorax sp. J22G21]